MAVHGFAPALAHVLAEEGGFVDHPLDPGGATKMGITRATLARVRGRPVSIAEVMALTRAEAAAIYRRLYWDGVRGDDLPPGVDLMVFDMAVHSGPRRAVRLLQRALGVAEDGLVGPVTLEAARAAAPGPLVATLASLRTGFLARLPAAAVFGRGWRQRVAAVERAALRMAAPAAGGGPGTSVSKDGPEAGSAWEVIMTHAKSFLASRTVWANLIGFAAIALSLLGFDVTGIDRGALTEAILQIVAGASFVLSTIGHIAATRRDRP